MKKYVFVLVGVLIIAALYNQAVPVTEVRYNTYNKSVNCYTADRHLLPEGCGFFSKPTVAQTLTGYLVILSSIGLIMAGLVALGQSFKVKN